jgi:hypothetical protein
MEFLRLQNIFGPMGQNSPTYPEPMGPSSSPMPMNMGEQPFDVTGRMRELYNPQNEATDRFNQLAQGYPEYEKPGIWRSIAGALTAFGPGGHQLGMQVANQNNARRLEDWKNQIGPAQQAANLERQENVNARTLAHQTVQGELTSRRNEATARNQEVQNKIRQQRADIYDFKTRNPNLKFDFSGPKVKILDPATGGITVTEWDTGNLSDTDKISLEQKNALARIEATGGQARETEKTRQEGRESLAETRGWKVYNVPDPNNPGKMKGVKINEITGDVKDLDTGPVTTAGAGGAGNRPELPTQTKVREFNKAREIYNTRPDLRPFLKLGTNDFTVLPSSSYRAASKAEDAKKIAELNELLYGTKPPSTGGRGGGSGRGNQPTQGLRVRDKNGRTGTFKGTAEEAKNAGYTVIGQ